MHINELPAWLIGWLLYLPAIRICLLLGLLVSLAIMMVQPLVVDWLGVRDHDKN